MIGLLFGSFDPIHLGHLKLISDCLNSGAVDKIIIIPTYHNSFKKKQTDYDTRVKMIKACIENSCYFPWVEIDEIEGKLGKLGQDTHTYNIIDRYDKKNYTWIATYETLKEVVTWENPEIVYNRPIVFYNESIYRAAYTMLPQEISSNITNIVNPKDAINYHSTNIREYYHKIALKNDLYPNILVSPQVHRIIVDNMLYI